MAMGTVDNWDLIKEHVENEIIRIMNPALVYDKASDKRSVKIGNVVEIVTQETQLSVQTITESTELQSDDLTFDRDTVVMVEKGVAPRVKQRFIDDAAWDVLKLISEEIGIAFATQLNEDFITTVEAGVAAGNTFATANLWDAAAADPIGDIAQLLRYLEENNYGKGSKVLLLHPHAYQYLRSTEDLYYVNRHGNDSVMTTGFIDEIFGIPILTSTDCTETVGLLIDTNIGAVRYYEREPLTVVQDGIPRLRSLDIIAYSRYAFHVVRPNAIAMVTGLL